MNRKPIAAIIDSDPKRAEAFRTAMMRLADIDKIEKNLGHAVNDLAAIAVLVTQLAQRLELPSSEPSIEDLIG